MSFTCINKESTIYKVEIHTKKLQKLLDRELNIDEHIVNINFNFFKLVAVFFFTNWSFVVSLTSPFHIGLLLPWSKQAMRSYIGTLTPNVKKEIISATL